MPYFKTFAAGLLCALALSGCNQSTGSAGLVDNALAVAQELSGFQVIPLTPEGCHVVGASPEQLQQLVNQIPSPHNALISALLNNTQPVWASQLYFGSYGVGLCLPYKNMTVLIPPNLVSPELINAISGSFQRLLQP